MNKPQVAEVSRIYPGEIDLDDSIPAAARKYLSQSISSINAPDGAAMLAASAVDAMLKGRGLESGSLYSRIERAVEQNVMTSDMATWAHKVRLDANDVRHADMGDPHRTEGEARQLVDFATALAEFLFVLPSRVKKAISESKPEYKE